MLRGDAREERVGDAHQIGLRALDDIADYLEKRPPPLTYYAALKGCSSNEEVSLKTIAFLIDKVNEEQLPTVFYIEFSSEKVANTIADATGVETLRLHSCHNVSKADFDNGVTYLDLMWQNVESLRKAVS